MIVLFSNQKTMSPKSKTTTKFQLKKREIELSVLSNDPRTIYISDSGFKLPSRNFQTFVAIQNNVHSTIILAFFDNCLKFWSSNTFSGHDRLEAQLWSLHCPKCLFPENWRSMTREFSTVSRLKLNSSLFCICSNHWQVFSSSFWGPITWWQKWQSLLHLRDFDFLGRHGDTV